MGRLVVVPTPIGNLEDITLRALRELKQASLILAEDTRRTGKLLKHYGIGVPVLSYHEHNRTQRLDRVLEALEDGNVALVSDAGMPGISDPGTELLASAIHLGIRVDVLPGANAASTAAVFSTFARSGFLFVGFLPRARKDREVVLGTVVASTYPTVLYEAPHRLLQTLTDLEAAGGSRRAVLCRELTKMHQEIVRGDLSFLREHVANTAPRGEFTIVIEGHVSRPVDQTPAARAELIRLKALGEDRRMALHRVAAIYGISRNQAYRLWLEEAVVEP